MKPINLFFERQVWQSMELGEVGDIAVSGDYHGLVCMHRKTEAGWDCGYSAFTSPPKQRLEGFSGSFLDVPTVFIPFAEKLVLPPASVSVTHIPNWVQFTNSQKVALMLGLAKVNLWRSMDVPENTPVEQLKFLGFGGDENRSVSISDLNYLVLSYSKKQITG